METVTARLLAELRAAGYSWYRIARLLSVRDQTVTKWKNGENMSPDSAQRACEALGKTHVEGIEVLMELTAEKVQTDDGKRYIQEALRLIRSIKHIPLALVAFAALLVGTPPPPAAGAVVQRDVATAYYVKSRRRRPKRRSWVDTIRRAMFRTWAAV